LVSLSNHPSEHLKHSGVPSKLQVEQLGKVEQLEHLLSVMESHFLHKLSSPYMFMGHSSTQKVDAPFFSNLYNPGGQVSTPINIYLLISILINVVISMF